MENYLNISSAVMAIGIFIIVITYKLIWRKEIILTDLIIAAISGGMLPLAFAFIIFPFSPELIPPIETISLQITLTGLILIFVYVKTIFDKL